MGKNISELIEHRRVLVAFMAQHNRAVVVEFSGSGDDGSINDIHLACPNGNEPWVEVEGEAHAAARELCYHFLDKQGLDWYNDDGGEGTVTFNLDGTVECNTNIRVTEFVRRSDEYEMDRELSMARLKGEAA